MDFGLGYIGRNFYPHRYKHQKGVILEVTMAISLVSNERLTQYQLYKQLPDLQWTPFGINVHPLKEGIFFDLLLYNPEVKKIALIFVNAIKNSGTVEIPPLANSLNPIEKQKLYEMAITTIYQHKNEIQAPNTFFWIQNVPEIRNLIGRSNPFRRSIPGMTDLVNTFKYFQHYRDVKSLIKQNRYPRTIKILDCSCGAGYGSIILGSIADAEILGADVDPEAVQIAQMLHLEERNISFECHALEDKVKDNERFDYLVSLETMEHVDNPNLFLESACELLKDDGYLFLSVPHWRFHGSDLNSDHRTNWSPEKLTILLKRYFENFQLFASEVFTLENFFTGNPSFREIQTIPQEKIEHILAVATKRELKKRFFTPSIKSNLKVLFVNHSIPPYEHTGTPIVTENQMESLKNMGHEVAALIPHPDAKTPLDKEILGGKTIYKIPPLNWYQTFLQDAFWGYEVRTYLNLVEKVIDDFRPDLVHINDYVFMTSKIVELFEALGIPMVREVHLYEELCFNTRPFVNGNICVGPKSPEKCAECVLQKQYPTNKLFRLREKALAVSKIYARFEHINLLYRNYEAILFPCKSWMDQISTFINCPQDKSYLVPIGVEFKVPRSKKIRKNNACPHFAFIGTLAKVKGIELLMRAFLDERILKKEFRLSIFGKTAESEIEKEILEFQKKLGNRVIYRGSYQRENLPYLLADVDVGIIPYYVESYSIATREFLYLGIPVIASNVFGVVDIIRDGENGLLFENGNEEELKEKILHVLENPALVNQLKEGTLQTHVPTLQEEARMLETIYFKILERQHRYSEKTNRTNIQIPEKYDETPIQYSIILLTKDNTESFAELLQTIKVTFPGSYEIVTIVNESSIKKISMQHPDVKVVQQSNKYLMFDLNREIQRAGGEHIIVVSLDSSGSKTNLDKLRAEIFPDFTITPGLSPNCTEDSHLHLWITENDMTKQTLMCFKKEVVEKIGGFDPCYEENFFGGFTVIDFYIRATRAGFNTKIIPDAIYKLSSVGNQLLVKSRQWFNHKWGLPAKKSLDKEFLSQVTRGDFSPDEHFVPFVVESLPLDRPRSKVYLCSSFQGLEWFLQKFHPEDDVTLVLYNPQQTPQDIEQRIKNAGYDPNNIPDILFHPHSLSYRNILSLIAATDAVIIDQFFSFFTSWIKHLRKEAIFADE